MSDGFADDLWSFSLALYARPGVAAACLSLQDEADVDVNVLLCAMWIGATGRGRLAPTALADLDAAARPLRETAVEPLRAVRRALKPVAAADRELVALREAVKRVELDAERQVQRRLQAAAPTRGAAAGSIADARANVETCVALRHRDAQHRHAAAIDVLAAALVELCTDVAGPSAKS